MPTDLSDTSIIKCDRKQNNIPYIDYVYSLFLFTRELYRKCIEDGIKNIFFLSREGQILKELFDSYLQLENNRSIKTHYFYTSRISSFVASLKNIENESFDTLFRSYRHLSLFKFMENCGFQMQEIQQVMDSLDLDFNKKIINIAESDELKSLKKNRVFLSAYERIRTKQNRCFLDYLNSFHVDIETEGLNIVDIGWKGTMQDNFYRILGDKIKITGYYLGLNEGTDYNEFMKKKGILFSCVDEYSPYFDVFLYDFDFYERLLFANHGSVLRYSEDDSGLVMPVLSNLEDDMESRRLIAPTQKEIARLFPKIYHYFKANKKAMDVTCEIAKLHLQTILRYGESEKTLQIQMKMHHSENFGTLGFFEKTGTDIVELIRNVMRFNRKKRMFLFTTLLQLNIRYRNRVGISKILVRCINMTYPSYDRQQKRLKG